MATIFERKYNSGTIIVRVMLRKKGSPPFCLSFQDWDAACDWLENNEEKFYKDPAKYFLWREKENEKMRRNRLKVYQGMIRRKRPF